MSMNRRNRNLGGKLLFLLLLLLLQPLAVMAQYSNTIYTSAVSFSGGTGLFSWNIPGVGGTTTSIQNIGQSMHFFQVTSQDVQGHTCNTEGGAGGFAASLQASYTGVTGTYFDVPKTLVRAVVGAISGVQRSWQAVGAYPYLRLLISNPTTSACTYTANYSGILFTAPVLPRILTPDTTTDLQQSNNILSAAANATVISGQAGLNISVYGMTVCNSTAAQTVIIRAGAASTIFYELPNMAAGQCMTLPVNSFTAYMGTGAAQPQGADIVVNLANATAVSVTMLWRYE